MFRSFYLMALLVITCRSHALLAEVAPIYAQSDGDQYIFNQTYTTNRSYMNVGQYAYGYNLHYYVGFANWAGVDLTPLQGASSTVLKFYVQDFLVPDLSNGGGSTSRPTLIPVSTGNFTLKVVALSEITNTASIDNAWVRSNMIDAAGVGSITLTNSGYASVEVGNTVANWISAGSGSRWLGFVGTGPSSSPYTSITLGTLEDNKNLDGMIITPAKPMYLTTPSTPPPVPAARSSRIISTNEMEITFDVVPGFSYVLTTKSNLSDTNWATLYPSFVASSNSTNLIVPMTNSLGRGFYRLEVAAP